MQMKKCDKCGIQVPVRMLRKGQARLRNKQTGQTVTKNVKVCSVCHEILTKKQ